MPPASKPRVLLCDDAAAFSVLFERWMQGCGLELVGRTDRADEAVALARELAPDVIVIDHLLRDVTSDGLAPCLREANPGVKLLLISGMPDDRLAEAARVAGADGHLSKAATADEMCAAVVGLLEPR